MRLIDVDELIKYFDEDLEGYDNREYILQMLDAKGRIERIDAIPIEWIKEYLVKLHKEGEEERDYVINELGGYEPIYKYIYETGIREMLEDWEKENEIQV